MEKEQSEIADGDSRQNERIVICEGLLCDRADEIDANGNLYTEQALASLDGMDNIPVTLGFDFENIIGTAKVKYVKGKGLFCTIKGMDKKVFEGMKIAPCYSVDGLTKTEKGYIVNKCDLKSLGACEKHSLNDIPSI